MLPLGGYRYIGKIQHLNLETQHFPFLTAIEPSESDFQIYWQLWKQERKLFLKRRLLLSRKGVQVSFLRACYFLRHQVEDLPLFIGIPVEKEKSHFAVVATEWQLLWLMFLVENGENFNYISSKMIYKFYKRYPSLFLDQKKAIYSLENYHFLLQELGITCISSEFDEKVLFRLLYAQFLAKR